MRYVVGIFVMAVVMVPVSAWAAEDALVPLQIEETLEAEDSTKELAFDDVSSVEEYMITQELEGKIKEVGYDYIVVMIEDGKNKKLFIDAETLIYVNDEKNDIEALKEDDTVFAYYVEEHGGLKCDWLEVSR